MYLNSGNSTITNNGDIVINDANADGISVKGTFTNNGSISILNYGDEGISTATSTAPLFVNNGSISIDANDSGGSEGLIIRGTGGVSMFENFGSLTILNSFNEGIVIDDFSTIENSGSITVTNAGIPRGSSDNALEIKEGIFDNFSGAAILGMVWLKKKLTCKSILH